MAHGVEARVPFVDGPLMHFALSLPAQYLMSGELTKPLLRDAVGDFLPALVLNRRDKIGFQTAEQKWFAMNQHRVNSLVEEAIGRLPSLFGTTTKKKVMDVLSGKEQFNNIPWRVLSMLFWAKSHEVEA
jgi:asparagine synthase (glutamine-hydrolysing)